MSTEAPRESDGSESPVATGVPAISLPDLGIELQLIELRKSFSMVFKAGIVLMLGVLFLVIASLIYISAYNRIGDRLEGPTTPEIILLEKYATIRLMQVSFGMLIGFCCVFFGILLSWLGITSAFSFGGSGQGAGGKASLTLQSASPGIALLIGGIILTGISLSKQIDFQLPGPNTPGGVSQSPRIYPVPVPERNPFTITPSPPTP